MKRLELALRLCLIPSISFASDARFDISIDASKTVLAVKTSDGTELSSCVLATKAQEVRLSYDGSAVILSETEFLPTSSLFSCTATPLVPKRIAPNVGALVDVNISKRLFLTVAPIGTNPLAFLAIVSRFGSTHNLVSLPGAYVSERPIKKLQEQGFSYSDDDPPRISPNGRYVSPGGTPDCSKNAYPGVWDIKLNKRVVLGRKEEMQSTCDLLFQ